MPSNPVTADPYGAPTEHNVCLLSLRPTQMHMRHCTDRFASHSIPQSSVTFVCHVSSSMENLNRCISAPLLRRSYIPVDKRNTKLCGSFLSHPTLVLQTYIIIMRLGLDSLRTRLIAQRVLRISWSEPTIYKVCTHPFSDTTVRQRPHLACG